MRTTMSPVAWQPRYLDGPCPGERWEERTPEAVGLSPPTLDALAAHVGGRGCVVRHGYLAYSWDHLAGKEPVNFIQSTRKPIISTLLLVAVQEGLIGSVDDPVVAFEPRLRNLPGDKDERITWRHLASQTSGYGWSEEPGAAWSYNNFGIALYYHTLMERVFREHGTDVLQSRLARPLGFQDPAHFEAFGPDDSERRGHITMTPRDHARFGLLYLRGGAWRGQQLLRRDLIDMALTSIVPADVPPTAGEDRPVLPGTPTQGGKGKGDHGPGQYSFNWWLNLPDRHGQLVFPAAPGDAYIAIGLGLTVALWVIPSLDLVVAWQEARWSGDDKVGSGRVDSVHHTAARLLVEAVVN